MLPALLVSALAFNPGSRNFATFGNAASKELINRWQPRPIGVSSGDAFLPDSKENLQRFVRARLLLEDPSVAAIASYGEGDDLSVVLCRFSRAEHSVLLPLWQPTTSCERVFADLRAWHKERFGSAADAPRLSGSQLEYDKGYWSM